MKIGIVHYHLRRGGVTRVIETAMKALEARGHEVAVFTGDAGPTGMVSKVIDGLGYAAKGSAGQMEALHEQLTSAAKDAFGTLPDVWHVHNPAIGKNVMFPHLCLKLAASVPLVIQVHDFAEDGRPENFRRQFAFDSQSPVWPQAAQIHYVTINGRDHRYLGKMVPEERLHQLPNAVMDVVSEREDHSRTDLYPDQCVFLYPTRGIRRKNIGELLLHARLGRKNRTYITTLAPENNEWRKIHRYWEELAKTLELSVSLGDHGCQFNDLMRRADALITTSIAEGFGLAFLEPSLAGKPIVGRNLPEITDDFTVPLAGLYDRFPVPATSIDQDHWRKAIGEAMQASYAVYGREVPGDGVEKAMAARTANDGTVDFGCLNEALQTVIIENPEGVEPPSIAPRDAEFVAKQAAAVANEYGMERYGERLESILNAAQRSTIEAPKCVGSQCLLDAFLSPENFHLLRT